MNKNQRKGMTLVEVMVAAVVVVVAVLGAMAFRYVTALDAKKADMQSSAARIGLLVLEEWKARDGSLTNYDPVAVFAASGNLTGIIVVQTGSGGSAKPSGFSGLPWGEFYEIRENNMYFYATLSYKDESSSLRNLNVRVGWLPAAAQGTGSNAIGFITLSNFVIP